MGILQQPGAVRFLDERRLRAQDAGQQADHGVHHHHRRQLATGQDVVADRQLLVDQVLHAPARRRPRSARRSGSVRQRRLSSRATACVNSATARAQQHHPGFRSTDRLDRAKSGSTFITMPGPPPYGVSSTVRWRSVANSRMSVSRMSSAPLSPRPLDDALVERPGEHPGKSVRMSMRNGRSLLQAPSQRRASRSSVPSPPSSAARRRSRRPARDSAAAAPALAAGARTARPRLQVASRASASRALVASRSARSARPAEAPPGPLSGSANEPG